MIKPNGLSIYKLAVLILLFLPLRLYHIESPLIEMHNVRQTQTAMITRNLLQDHFNVFLTRIDWEGNAPGYFVQEFPFYNLIVAPLWKLFGISDVWGRVVSLFFGAVAAWYLYKITATLFSDSVAFWAVAFFAVCPISVFMSEAFMINMCSLGLALAGFYYLMIWTERLRARDAIIGTACLTLSALTNNTVTFLYLIPLAYLFWIRRRKQSAFILGSVFMPLIFVALNLAWYAHAARVNALYYPEFNGAGLLSHFLSVTRFNRLDPYYYLRMGMYFGYFVLGLPAFLLAVWGLRVLWQDRWSLGTKVVIAGLLGTFLYYAVFFNALVGHNYYTLPVVPVVAWIIGVGISNLFERYGKRRTFAPVATVFVIAYAIGFVFPFLHMHEPDTIAYEAAMAVKANTKPEDLVLVATLHTNVAPGEMYPTILYYTDRRGWNLLTVQDPAIDDAKVASLIQQGADYLVISYGQPERKPVSSLFPLYKYFSHTVDISPKDTLDHFKQRYQLILETKNYALFRLDPRPRVAILTTGETANVD